MSQVDAVSGEYIPPSVAVQKEGNDAAAVKGIQTYLVKAMSHMKAGKTMNGRPWFCRHPMTNRVLMLYITHSFKDTSGQHWREREIEEAEGEDENDPKNYQKEKKRKGQPAALTGTTPKAAKKSSSSDPEARLKELIASAGKLKTQMLEASTACNDLLTLIHTSPEWEVFDTAKQLAGIREARGNPKNRSGDTLGLAFLVCLDKLKDPWVS